MRLLIVPFTMTVALISIMAGAPAEAGVNGNACRAECTYPYDAVLYYHSSSAPRQTPDAVAECSDFLDLRGKNWLTNGFLLRWLDNDPPADGEAAHFHCYACVNGALPNPFEGSLSDENILRLETATSIAIGMYGGEVDYAKRYFTMDRETGRAGAGYLLRLTGSAELEGSAGMIEVDPIDGRVIRHHPVNCEER